MPETHLPVEAARLGEDNTLHGGLEDLFVEGLLEIDLGEIKDDLAYALVFKEGHTVDQREGRGRRHRRIAPLAVELIDRTVAVLDGLEIVFLGQVGPDPEQRREGEDDGHQALLGQVLGETLEILFGDLERRDDEARAFLYKEGRRVAIEGVEPGTGYDRDALAPAVAEGAEDAEMGDIVGDEDLLASVDPVFELGLEPARVALGEVGVEPEDEVGVLEGHFLLVLPQTVGVLLVEEDHRRLGSGREDDMEVGHPAHEGVDAVAEKAEIGLVDLGHVGRGRLVVARETVETPKILREDVLPALAHAAFLDEIDRIAGLVASLEAEKEALGGVEEFMELGGKASRIVDRMDAERIALDEACGPETGVAHLFAVGVGVRPRVEEGIALPADIADLADPAEVEPRPAGLVGPDIRQIGLGLEAEGLGAEGAVDVEEGFAAGEVALELRASLGEGADRVDLVVVDHVAIGRDDGAHVFGAFHPALDLEGGNARVDELGHAGDELEIVGRKIKARAGLGLVHASTGLGAKPPVGALAPEIAREETEPRGADAEGAMDEDLGLEIGRLGDRLELLEGELASHHGAFEAPARKEIRRLGGGDVHLGRGVETQPREVPVRELGDAEILDDHAVGTDPVQILEKLVHAIGLALLEDRIDGDIDLLQGLMTDFDRRLELIESEIR